MTLGSSPPAAIPRAQWRARYAALVGLWLVTVILAAVDYARDPYDASLVGTARYGHNSEGILATIIPLTMVELGVALAILRPRSYRRAWSRAGVACVLFTVWGLASAFAMMHAGGVVTVHALWVMALAFGCFVVTIWSLIGRRRDGARF